MRRKSPVSRAVSRYENTPRGAEGSCGARLQSSVPVGAELTWSCSIIHHGLPPGSGSFPAGAGGTRSPRSPGTLRIPDSPRTAARARPRRDPAAPPQLPLLPREARLTLILSTAASSFSCSTRRCMVLRLPADDMTGQAGTGWSGGDPCGAVRCGAARLCRHRGSRPGEGPPPLRPPKRSSGGDLHLPSATPTFFLRDAVVPVSSS